jgi:hypothetical protein
MSDRIYRLTHILLTGQILVLNQAIRLQTLEAILTIKCQVTIHSRFELLKLREHGHHVHCHGKLGTAVHA